MNIELTDHICERYIERINPQLASIANNNQRLTMAKKAIIAMLTGASYVSDDHRGVLLYSKDSNCLIIIRHRKLITLYPPNKKSKNREYKHKLGPRRRVSNGN